jgi:hypothetical protein
MGTTYELHNTSRQPGARLFQAESRRPRRLRDGGNVTAGGLNPDLVRQIRTLCEQLKSQFGDELRERALVMKASRVFVRSLLPRRRGPGRPQSAAITAALELLNQGIPWQQVPWKVIPGFEEMSRPEQTFKREHLRRGIRMRRKRSGVTNQKQGL